jgi:hypothetical protein
MPKTNQTANPQVPIRLIWTPGTRYHKTRQARQSRSELSELMRLLTQREWFSI